MSGGESNRGLGQALLVSVVLHLVVVIAVTAITLWPSSMPLTGEESGDAVQVSLGDPNAAPPQKAKEEPKERDEPPPPKKDLSTPVPEPPKATPEPLKATPEPVETPVPTAKPELKSTPKPEATPIPEKPEASKVVKKTPVPEKKKEEKPKPTATPRPTPIKTPKATPTPTPYRITRETSSKLRSKHDPDFKDARTAMREREEKAKAAKSAALAKTSNKSKESSNGAAGSKGTSANKAGATISKEGVTDGGTTLKGSGLPEYYAQQALAVLSSNFRIPPEMANQARAVVGFRISRDGTLSNIRILTSSGDPERDKLALRAVEITRKLAPFPDDFEKAYVDAEAAFRFQE